MPPILHRHLRTGLDYDSIDPAPEDLLESLPDEYYDPQQRAAKRRRLEAIATSVIKGQKPIILSATLRGPFEKWENPWGTKGAGKDTIKGKEKNERIVSRVTKGGKSHARIGTEHRVVGATVTARSNYRSKLAKRNGIDIAQEPPAFHVNHNGNPQQEDEHQERDMESITGRTAEEHYVATECFTIADQSVLNHGSPPSGPPPPERFIENMNPTATPLHQVDTQSEGQHTAPPAITLTKTHTMNTEWRSSASASMLISSPVRASAAANPSKPSQYAQERASPQSRDSRIPCNQTMEDTILARDQLNVLHSTRSSARRPEPNTPNVLRLQEANSSVAEGYQSARQLAWNAINRVSQTGQQGTPVLRDSIMLSAAVCAQETPTPVIKDPAIRRSGRRTSKEVAQRQPISHDLVASPALGSSIGFVYRKTEKTKSKEKANPRLLTFSSSPGITKDSNQVMEEAQLDPATLEKDGNNIADQGVLAEVQARRPDVYDTMGTSASVAEECLSQGEPDSRRSSRLFSNYSTQAALLLAQMEFQDGTFSSVSSDTPRAHWHLQDDTPQPNRREPSPVITPFHTFNAELDKRHPIPPDSVFRGPPLSTQDLFAAASPFAFSTMKKKSVRPQRSILRFSVLSNGKDEHDDGARSPTPSAERMPLKDRNYKVSFKNSPFHGSQTSVNGSQTEKASQESMLQTQKPTRIDVGLPLLDFHPSLDDLGPNGDLEFTDRFLRNLDGIT
jgi:hypothetical protein